MRARIIAFCARTSASQSVRRNVSCSMGVGVADVSSSLLSMRVPFRCEPVCVEATDSKRGVNPHQFCRGAPMFAPGGA